MVSHHPRNNQARLNISSRQQRHSRSARRHPFPKRALLHRILHRGVSPDGVPYAVVKLIDPAGRHHRALACERWFGDLQQLEVLEGREVSLLSTRNGLQVLPPDQQVITPDLSLDQLGVSNGERATQSAVLSEVVSAVAQVAKGLELPTAVWIHIP